MADEERDGDGVRSPSHRSDGVDSISGLPDVILQTILSSLPTKFAIRTSILSKRWRHVWCDTPCLNFDSCGEVLADSVNGTLARYKASKMMSFHFSLTAFENSPYIESWIEFAKSRNVEKMTLDLGLFGSVSYTMPDSFYIDSSLKQLTLSLGFRDKMIPSSSVSWTSLKELVLRKCKLADGSTIPKILSGSPVLESLTLDMCRCYNLIKVLDLSKSLRLTTLEIASKCWESGQIDIVAPHIHSLSLTIPPYWPCNLVDVSSLTHARLDIGFYSHNAFYDYFLEPILRNMIEKLHNVDKLTFGENFIKIFSLADFHRVPLPLLKFKTLTFETMVSPYLIPGVVKLLQSSPELKKLIVHIKDGRVIPDEFFDSYLSSHGLKRDKTWSSEARVFKKYISRKIVEPTHMVSFIELVLKSTKTLEHMVVRFGSYLEDRRFEELLEMVPMLSQNNNNVSIVLGSTTKSDQRFKCYNYILKM